MTGVVLALVAIGLLLLDRHPVSRCTAGFLLVCALGTALVDQAGW